MAKNKNTENTENTDTIQITEEVVNNVEVKVETIPVKKVKELTEEQILAMTPSNMIPVIKYLFDKITYLEKQI